MTIKDSAGTARRLRLLRTHLGFESPRAFAEKLEISPQQLANLEDGFPLTTNVALRLCKKYPGLTLDWLYTGSVEPLAPEYARLDSD